MNVFSIMLRARFEPVGAREVNLRPVCVRLDSGGMLDRNLLISRRNPVFTENSFCV